jgi:hypothetical protein
MNFYKFINIDNHYVHIYIIIWKSNQQTLNVLLNEMNYNFETTTISPFSLFFVFILCFDDIYIIY